MAFVSLIEPKNLNEAIIDEHWIIAMQEELNQFERNQVWGRRALRRNDRGP